MRSAELPQQGHILLSRPDRMGDLVLSLPTLHKLKQARPDLRVSFLIQDWLVPLFKGVKGVERVIPFKPKTEHKGLSGLGALARTLSNEKFDAIIHLHPNTTVLSAAMLARIPVRVGPLSKPLSYLFLNRGLRQHRSESTRHEAQYSVELLGQLGIKESLEIREVEPFLDFGESVRNEVQDWMGSKNFAPTKGFVAIHPGMGGSALNWPQERYREVAKFCLARGVGVVASFGPGESALRDEFCAALGTDQNFIVYEGDRELGFLGELYRKAICVLAPSTGPIHLASAVGCPVVGIYPSIQVQSPTRWGPLGSKALTLEPSRDCGQKWKCCGPGHPNYPCMNLIDTQLVIEHIQSMLRTEEKPSVNLD